MSRREEVLVSQPATEARPPWSVKRTQPDLATPGFEPLEIRIDGEFDLDDPTDRALVGEIADALRHALNTRIRPKGTDQ